MVDADEKMKLQLIQEEARAAFDEFLRRLNELESQRKDIVKDTLEHIDQKKIQEMRKKLGLPQVD